MKKFSRYLFALINLIMFSFFMYICFIRERLPKDMLLDKNITKVITSFINIPILNEFHMQHISENVLTQQSIIESTIKDIQEQNKLKSLIPETGQKAHVDVWHDFMLNIIKRMPTNVRENMLENYHKFKLIEHGHDL